MHLISFCLVLLLLSITLVLCIATYNVTRNQSYVIIAALLSLAVFGYAFQFLNIILIDMLDQFKAYYLSK